MHLLPVVSGIEWLEAPGPPPEPGDQRVISFSCQYEKPYRHLESTFEEPLAYTNRGNLSIILSEQAEA